MPKRHNKRNLNLSIKTNFHSLLLVKGSIVALAYKSSVVNDIDTTLPK